jgi:NADP-dependent 3-hydroxy acid dehydrogenase YdfG
MNRKLIEKIVNLAKAKIVIPVVYLIFGSELLKSRITLISGGSGFIGITIAKSFLKSDCKVILAGTSVSKLQKANQEVQNLHGHHMEYRNGQVTE